MKFDPKIDLYLEAATGASETPSHRGKSRFPLAGVSLRAQYRPPWVSYYNSGDRTQDLISWKQANLLYKPNIQRAVARLKVVLLSPDLHWHVAPQILYCICQGKPFSRLAFRSWSRCGFPNGFIWGCHLLF